MNRKAFKLFSIVAPAAANLLQCLNDKCLQQTGQVTPKVKTFEGLNYSNCKMIINELLKNSINFCISAVNIIIVSTPIVLTWRQE